MMQAAADYTTLRGQKVGRATRGLLLSLCASVFVAAAAHVAFPLPFTPVPFTLQPLAVLLVGLFLGPWQGGMALLAYLVEGLCGLPVFSPTGPGGLAQLIGPTGGFLLAYPVVAFLAGGLVRKIPARRDVFPAAALSAAVATLVLFTSGASWLAFLAHLSCNTVLKVAVLPFVPGEAVKILAVAGIYRALGSFRQYNVRFRL